MKKYLLILLIPLSLHALSDKIIGVVDKEAITLSEVEQKLKLMGIPVTQESKEKMLENIIQTKLLLIAAERDTVTVSDEEIEDAMLNTINSLKKNFKSEQAFYTELQRMGMTEEDLREYYREDVRSNLIVRALIQKKFGAIYVSDIEALHYYETYPESIPDIPTTVRFIGIFLPIIPSEKTLREKQELIETVHNKLLAGEDFGKLAGIYSEDPVSKNNGGDLGTVNIDDLDPLFRQEIESMAVGEIKLVQGPGLVHLLRCDRKFDNNVTLRSIVFRLTPTREDTLTALGLASQIKDSIDMGVVPHESERIIVISDGKEYLPQPPLLEDMPVEDETKVIEHEDGIYVIKLFDRKESRRPTFDEVNEDLKALLYQKKTLEKLNYLISKLEDEIYVDRRV